MFTNWFNTGSWGLRMKSLTLEQSLKAVERALVLAKTFDRGEDEVASASFYAEAWSELDEPVEDTVGRLRTTLVMRLAEMCESIATAGLASYPKMMHAIFDDLVEVRPD